MIWRWILYQKLFDLTQHGDVKGVVHAGGAENAEQSFIIPDAVFTNYDRAGLNLRNDVFLADVDLRLFVHAKLGENVEEIIVIFQNLDHLGGSDWVLLEFRLLEDVGESEEECARAAGNCCETYIVRRARQDIYRVVDFFFRLFRGVFCPNRLEEFLRFARGGLVIGDLLHELAIAEFGGDATGGGVWLEDETFFLQCGHFAANGGWGDLELVAHDDCVGAYWFGGRDEVLNDRFQDLCAAVEVGHGISIFCRYLGLRTSSV